MRTLKLIGHVDEQHRLSAKVPAHIAPGPIEVELAIPSNAGLDAASSVERPLGLLRGKVRIGRDFDEPLEEFESNG